MAPVFISRAFVPEHDPRPWRDDIHGILGVLDAVSLEVECDFKSSALP